MQEVLLRIKDQDYAPRINTPLEDGFEAPSPSRNVEILLCSRVAIPGITRCKGPWDCRNAIKPKADIRSNNQGTLQRAWPSRLGRKRK